MPDTGGIIVELAMSSKSKPRKLGLLVGVSPLRLAQAAVLMGVCKLEAQAYPVRLWECGRSSLRLTRSSSKLRNGQVSRRVACLLAVLVGHSECLFSVLCAVLGEPLLAVLSGGVCSEGAAMEWH